MRLRTILSAAALAAASAAGAQTVELNVISKVQVQDAGNEVVVSIKGSKPPNFTTFSMMDPPRFVIDVSESTFQNVPEDITGGGGLIQVVKNLSYGSEATSIARVMIAFTREVDPPDVQTAGSELVVRIAKPADMGVAQRAAPPQPRAAPAATAAAPAAKPAADAAALAAAQQARLEAEEQARYETKARAESEKLARAEAEKQAKAEVEAELRAVAEAQALARAQEQQDKSRAADEAKARREAEAQAAALAKMDSRARAEEEKRLKAEEAKARREAGAQAKADARAEAKARAEAEAQAKAEEKRQAADEAKARREAAALAKVDAKARAEEEKRLKAEEAKARREAKAQAAALAKMDDRARAEEEKRLKAEEAKARREAGALKVASLPPPEPRAEALAPSGAPNQVREVGFQQLPGASRVFVRTAQEPRFTIMEAGENLIRVELANTRVKRRNDSRFMDTSFFPTAVALVTPKREGSTYVVEIKLKERVPYQQKVEGDMLAIDFERPAGLAAPPGQAAPGEPAPGEPPPPGGN